MDESMTDYIEWLAQVRAEAAGQEALVAAYKTELEQTLAFTRLQEASARFKELKEREEELADTVRMAALDLYNTTGDKKPHRHVQIKIFPKLVYDAAQALDYAIASLPAALKLDTKKFEAAAKALDLPFVTIEQEPKVYIDAKLGVDDD